MQGGDRAPAYPCIAGGMGLCESTLPQVGRALRPQEKGNNVGSLVYMGQRKGEAGRYPHHLGVHTNPCTAGTHLRMLPSHHWLIPLDYNLSRGVSVGNGKYNSWERNQRKRACGMQKSWLSRGAREAQTLNLRGMK